MDETASPDGGSKDNLEAEIAAARTRRAEYAERDRARSMRAELPEEKERIERLRQERHAEKERTAEEAMAALKKVERRNDFAVRAVEALEGGQPFTGDLRYDPVEWE